MKKQDVLSTIAKELSSEKVEAGIYVLGTEFPENVSPKSIALVTEFSPEDIIKAATRHGLRYFVQTTNTNFKREIHLASTMLSYPEKFMTDFESYILAESREPKNKLVISFRHSQERSDRLQKVREFVSLIPGAGHLQDVITGIVDELFTNAIYNAPVGPQGQSLFSSLSRKNAVELPPGMFGKLTVSFDHENLFVGCEDSYGSLNPARFFSHLEHCYGESGMAEVNMGEGGAGVGMRMIFERFSEFFVAIEEGKKTIMGGTLALGKSARALDQMEKNFYFLSFRK